MSGERSDRVRVASVTTLSDARTPLRRYGLDYVRRDGTRQRLERELFANGPAAAVLPVDPDRGTVLLTRQLRLAALLQDDPPWLIEACVGGVEPGDDPAETARKEAMQELGCRLQALRRVGVLYSSPGATAEKLHLFVARYGPGDRVAPGGGVRAEGEEVEVLEPALDDAWAMAADGRILDAKTVLLLQHVRLTGMAEPARAAPRSPDATTGGSGMVRETGGTAGESGAMRPGDQAPAGTPGTGEAICRDCAGSGRREGAPCPTCAGTGRVVEGIGGA